MGICTIDLYRNSTKKKKYSNNSGLFVVCLIILQCNISSSLPCTSFYWYHKSHKSIFLRIPVSFEYCMDSGCFDYFKFPFLLCLLFPSVTLEESSNKSLVLWHKGCSVTKFLTVWNSPFFFFFASWHDSFAPRTFNFDLLWWLLNGDLTVLIFCL